jgi:hypothetical protein
MVRVYKKMIQKKRLDTPQYLNAFFLLKRHFNRCANLQPSRLDISIYQKQI